MATGYGGLTRYENYLQVPGLEDQYTKGPVNFGLRGNVGGENSSWVVNPATGKEEPAFAGPDGGYYLTSDLIKKYGSLNGVMNQMGDEGPLFKWSGTRPSNDAFSGKDGIADALSIASMAAVPFTAGAMGAAGSLPAAAGTAAYEGGVGLGSYTGLGAVGSDVVGGGEGVNALRGTGEPGMWDWLDQMDMGGGYDPGGQGMYSPPPSETGAFDMGGSQGVFDSNGNPLYKSPFDLGGILKQYGAQGLSALKGLASGAGGTSPSHGGSALSGFLGNPGETAFNSAPFLLALAESNRQSGDLNGVINKINGQGYTDAVLHPYDMETGIGRSNMLQDLSLRNVSGSSFGNQQVGNYDYMRSLGRGDLASKAQLASAGLEGSLINQRNTNRNMLLGAGLNASARLFSPQSDPFGLRALGL